MRHLVEWRKAQEHAKPNDLSACAETIWTEGTALYDAVLRKLGTRIEARIHSYASRNAGVFRRGDTIMQTFANWSWDRGEADLTTHHPELFVALNAATGGKVRKQRRLGPLPNIDGVSFEHTLAAEDEAAVVEDTDEDRTSDEDEAEAPIRSLAGDMDDAADDADPDLDVLLQPEAGGAPADEKRLDLISTPLGMSSSSSSSSASSSSSRGRTRWLPAFITTASRDDLEGKAGLRRSFTPAPVSLTPTSFAAPTTAVRVRNKSQPAKKTQKKRKKQKNPNRLLFRQMRDRRAVVAAAGVLFARANRELSSLLAVRTVVVVKGGPLSKAGIKRDQSMGFSHSYSAIQRVKIGESADAELRAYNAARVQTGISHANRRPAWLPVVPPVTKITRPRDPSSANKENEAPPTKKRASNAPVTTQADDLAGPVEDLTGELIDSIKACVDRGLVSWTLIADNIDLMTKVKLMSKENKNKFLHFFHVIASLSRIPVDGRDDVACGDMKDFTFLGASQIKLRWTGCAI